MNFLKHASFAAAVLSCAALCAADDVIAYYQFQDAAPGTKLQANAPVKSSINSPALDMKTNATNASYVIEVSDDVPGKVIVAKDGKVVNADNKSSLRFTRANRGMTGTLSLAHNALLNQKEFTIECFVKLEKGADWGSLLNKARAGEFGTWSIQLQSNTGFLRSRLDLNADGDAAKKFFNICQETKFNLLDNQWHHIALTFDDETREVKLFADYQEQYSGKAPANLVFGEGALTVFEGVLSGNIDEMRFSDEALKTDEMLRVKK